MIALGDINTLGMLPLDEGSVRRRDLYLTHNIHKTHTFNNLTRLEPAIPASKRTQTYTLDGAAKEIGFEEISILFLPHLSYTISSAHVPYITR
jgi:hypothetical protein